MSWPVFQRLLSSLPGVRRAAPEKYAGTGLDAVAAPSWLAGEGIYPRRIFAPWIFEQSITRVGCEVTLRRPADWAIVLDLAEAPNPDATIADMYGLLHERGGYVICRLTAVAREPEAESTELLFATPEWWISRFEAVADLRGFSLTPLWRSMYAFQVLRTRLLEGESDKIQDDERKELDTWDLERVLMFEVRPAKAVRAEAAGRRRRWWEIWR